MRRETTAVRRVRHGGRNRRVVTRTRPSRAHGTARGLLMLLPWLAGSALVAGGVVGLHYGWRALVGSDRLRVETVELAGTTRVTPAEVRAYTGIRPGDSILDLDLDAAALALKRHPWISDVHVERRLPDRVVIDIVENVPRILVSLGDLYMADSDGRLFKKLSADDGVVLPVVTGLSREQAASEPARAARRVREAIELTAAVDARGAEMGRVEELHWDADLGWSVVARVGEETPYRAHLGVRPLRRVPVAAAALGELRARHREPRVIWADSVKTPGRVVARLRGEASRNARGLDSVGGRAARVRASTAGLAADGQIVAKAR